MIHQTYFCTLLFIHHLSQKLVESVTCRVYPSTNSGSYYFNTTCTDTCCSGVIASVDSACCSSLQWNTGVYVGLSVPLFCCVASLLAGFIYCFSVVKPNPRASSNSPPRFNIALFRSPAISPEALATRNMSIQSQMIKDDPPSYNELYSKKPTGDTHADVVSKNSNNDQLNQPPPAYLHHNVPNFMSSRHADSFIV